MTDADALVRATDGICDALNDAKPESEAMQIAVNNLMKTFKRKTEIQQTFTNKRMQTRAKMQCQRVASEESNK